MKRILPLFLFPLFSLFLTTNAQTVPDGNGIAYVKKGSTGNGSSWANARGELADALLDAKTNTAIKQIWVAAGTYHPLYRADDGDFGSPTTSPQLRGFLMVKDVKIYGGFMGFETNILFRSPQINRTILDGQQGSQRNDYCNTIVIAVGELGDALLDGVTVQNGNAISWYPNYNGIEVDGNTGGGILLQSSSPRIENVVVKGNYAHWGGGIYMKKSDTRLINCVLSGNRAAGQGGGLYVFDLKGQLINCTIVSNAASLSNGFGGYYFLSYGNNPVRNCIIWNNIGNPGRRQGNGSNLKNCLEQGTAPDPANNNIGDADPLLAYLPDPSQAPLTSGDFRILNYTSPVIDKGDNSFFPGLESNTPDIAGHRRALKTIEIGAHEYHTFLVEPDHNGIIYVKKGGTGNGSSWNNALDEVAHAVRATAITPTIKEIWVAKGTYNPLYREDRMFFENKDKQATFSIRRPLKIYGGFAGTEQSITERSFKTKDNETILSADFENDDTGEWQNMKTEFSNTSDNASNILQINYTDTDPVTLDGFTITGATQTAIKAHSSTGEFTLQLFNLTIRRNDATLNPVTIFNGKTLVKNCWFSLNNAGEMGGAIHAVQGSLTVLSSVFTENYSAQTGGAIAHLDNPCKIVNCTMVLNRIAGDRTNHIYSINSGIPQSFDIYNSFMLGRIPSIGVYTDLILSTNINTANESYLQHSPNGVAIGGNWRTQDNQSIYPNLLLQPGSSARDYGKLQAYLDAGGSMNDKDLAGNDRVFGASIDAGAFELVQLSQTISVSDMTQTYGDTDVEPAASISSNLPMSFATAENDIAEIYQDANDGNKTKIRLKKAGVASIVVTHNGNDEYLPATHKTIQLTINPRPLTITPASHTKNYGENDPVFSFSSSGLINNDAISGELTRNPGEQVNDYTITAGTITAGSNYTIDLQPASLTIKPKDLFLQAGAYERPFGEPNPALSIQYNGFIAGEGPADIIEPVIATTALAGSDPGDYPVTITGGSAANYTFRTTNGNLKITGAVVSMQQQPQPIAFCEGYTGDFSVTANAPSPLVTLQYQWESSVNGNNWQSIPNANSSTLPAVNKAALYRCIITAPGTRIESDAARSTINKAAVPTIQLNDKICIDNPVLMLNATPSGGQFSGNGISNNRWDLEIPAPGKQTIHYQYTDVNGCIGATSKDVMLTSCGDFASLVSVQAWPNPTTGAVTLKMQVGVADDWYINISDVEGKSVLQKKVVLRNGWNTVDLNIAPLPSGTYIISMGRGGFWKKGIQVIKK